MRASMPASCLLSALRAKRGCKTYFQSSVGRCFHGVQQWVKDRIMCYGESTINNPAMNVHPIVYLQDIVIVQNDIPLARIRSPVSANMVKAETCRKAHAGFECIPWLNTLMTGQSTNACFNLVGNLSHRHAWLGNGLDVLADLTVDFCSLAIVG